MTALPLAVTTVAHARAGLSGVLRRIRADPDGAQPVVLGSHRRAEAVILSYARYATIMQGTDVAGIPLSLSPEHSPSPESGQRTLNPAQPAAAPPGASVPAAPGPDARTRELDVAEQVDRLLARLESLFSTAAEIVDRGREAFRVDAALPLACEALAAHVGELAAQLVSAQPQRFSDPMWSLAARTREIVVNHDNRVDEQSLWILVSQGFPELDELTARARRNR